MIDLKKRSEEFYEFIKEANDSVTFADGWDAKKAALHHLEAFGRECMRAAYEDAAYRLKNLKGYLKNNHDVSWAVKTIGDVLGAIQEKARALDKDETE